MHVLILVCKDVIISTWSAGYEKQYWIISIPAVNEETVWSSVNIHYKLLRKTLRLTISSDLSRAHQCPYSEKDHRDCNYTQCNYHNLFSHDFSTYLYTVNIDYRRVIFTLSRLSFPFPFPETKSSLALRLAASCIYILGVV